MCNPWIGVEVGKKSLWSSESLRKWKLTKEGQTVEENLVLHHTCNSLTNSVKFHTFVLSTKRKGNDVYFCVHLQPFLGMVTFTHTQCKPGSRMGQQITGSFQVQYSNILVSNSPSDSLLHNFTISVCIKCTCVYYYMWSLPTCIAVAIRVQCSTLSTTSRTFCWGEAA